MSREQGGDDRIWLLLILLAGTLLRIWGLAGLIWEEDELYTLRDSADLGAEAAAGGAPGIAARPLYYLFQHLLLGIFPPTKVFLRLPPLVFGVAGIWATWHLGRTAFGRRAGLVAAALVAVSPWHLYASQFARYWSLVYLLAALAFGGLIAAIESDQRGRYIVAAVTIVLGMATHPTFLFPLAGAVVALHLVDSHGRFGLIRPTGAAVRWLWLPTLAATAIGFVALKLLARPESLQNWSTRGIAASFRLVPAMVQWAGVPIVIGAMASVLYLGWQEPVKGRRWALMTALGAGGAFALLVAASFRTGVYADYGIASLPLVLVAVAGLVDRVAARLADAGPRFALAAGLALAGSTAPEAVSYLSDGSRFDYRPAFDLIRRLGPDRPVLGHIEAIAAAEASDLDYRSMRRDDALRQTPAYWLITSIRRFGLREGRPRLQAWIDANCRRVAFFERPRFDYRLYRVELHWCGDEPLPLPSGRE